VIMKQGAQTRHGAPGQPFLGGCGRKTRHFPDVLTAVLRPACSCPVRTTQVRIMHERKRIMMTSRPAATGRVTSARGDAFRAACSHMMRAVLTGVRARRSAPRPLYGPVELDRMENDYYRLLHYPRG
jgi:hypothetical protein